MTEEHLEQLKKVFGIENPELLIPDIQKCMDARNRIIERKSDPGFDFGDLVIDVKNKEIGFVIGPFDAWNQVRSGKRIFSELPNKQDTNPVMLVVTKSRRNETTIDRSDIDNIFGEVATPSESQGFRVRYTRKDCLIPLGVEEPKKPATDLDIFCNSQCVMDCTTECSLYKYKRKNKN